MTLRLRLAVSFAAVALATGLVVAVAAPFAIERGFARLEADQAALPAATVAPGRPGAGGPPAGRGPAARAAQIQQDTTLTVVIIALGAALAASLLGALVAARIARPLRSLEDDAAAVAAGDLARRSGLGGRTDEVGSLGRSFDRMAAELQRSDDARRRLLQDAAHELRTPLAVIDATASAISDGVYAPEPRHLATIRDQSRLLARVVDDLRTVGLAEGGVLALRLERVPARELVPSVAEAFRARAEAAGIQLVVGPVPDVLLDVDRDRIRQALGALLDNAVRHTPRGGSIHVWTDLADARVRIRVADGGPGVAEQDLASVFDRFYQADPARDRSTGTTGLGLAIARAIATAHAGSVGVENRAEGGACFWIELPVADVSISPAAPSSM
jgi:two-component system sensor histidine kinase BaeS